MRYTRIIVLGIALSSGGIAAYMVGNSKPPSPAPAATQTKTTATVDVLVARTDIEIGKALTAGDIEWQPWPEKFASAQFIRKPERSTAAQHLIGFVARAPFVKGEPIREAKLIDAQGSGYMAAILAPGMRAVSTEITPAAGAGGFILPNDRVDVILTSAKKDATGKEYYQSQTILTDIRVLAIDQTVEEKSGKKTAIGKIATLELDPSNAEKLSLARRLGNISLTLRGLTEYARTMNQAGQSIDHQDNVTIVRFGQASSN